MLNNKTGVLLKKNNAVWIEDGSFHEAKFETCIKF